MNDPERSRSSNYSAWSIDAQGFADCCTDLERLRFLVRYAVLAPSGHNTQPWSFMAGENSLILRADASRILHYSGPAAQEPAVSLGSCIGVFEFAAAGFGSTIEVEYLQGEAGARISIGGNQDAVPSLLTAITNRTSNRSAYDRTPLDVATLDRVTSSDIPGVMVRTVTEEPGVSFLAEQTSAATLRIMSDPAFRNELSQWVRNNYTKKCDGMPGFVQGIPGPPSLLANHIIRRLDVSKDQAKKDSSRVRESPALAIIVAQSTDVHKMMDAGRVYSMMCVKAQQEGLATSGAGAAIVDPSSRQAIVERFGFDGVPMAITRIGWAHSPARHAPRWPASSVIVG